MAGFQRCVSSDDTIGSPQKTLDVLQGSRVGVEIEPISDSSLWGLAFSTVSAITVFCIDSARIGK